MRTTFAPLAAVLLSALVHAKEHGPICQWYQDPTTTMSVQWVQSGTIKGTSGDWELGRAGFGFADEDDVTVFDTMKGNFRSIYVRRPYSIPADLPDDAELVLEIWFDDGFVAYLDGKEVARDGVEGSGNTVQSVANHEAEKWEAFPLGKAKAGAKGVIAIEGHNTNLNSSDFSLHPRLVVRAGKETVPVIDQGELWNYLAGAIPEKDWTTRVRRDGEKPNERLSLYGFEVRPKGSSEWVRVGVESKPFGTSTHVVHSADLTGLKAGTTYEFRIGRRGEALGPWTFKTAPAEFEEGMTFVTGGDMYHTRENLDAMNARAGAEDALFALLGGDLAYANGVNGSRWLEWLDSWHEKAVAPDGRLIPMIAVIGNHEVKGVGFRPTNAPGEDNAPFYYSLFRGMEEGGQLAIDFGDYLSIVGLDSGHTRNIAKQSEWLKETLEERKEIPRLMVCYHRPAWGTGVKGDAKDIQKEWSPIFDQYQVDVVFENDHHVYKRTHPITADGTIDQEKGTLYLGDGAWGAGVRIVPKDWKEKRPWLAEAKSVNHLIKVTLGGEEFHYESMSADGKVFDETKRPLRRE